MLPDLETQALTAAGKPSLRHYNLDQTWNRENPLPYSFCNTINALGGRLIALFVRPYEEILEDTFQFQFPAGCDDPLRVVLFTGTPNDRTRRPVHFLIVAGIEQKMTPIYQWMDLNLMGREIFIEPGITPPPRLDLNMDLRNTQVVPLQITLFDCNQLTLQHLLTSDGVPFPSKFISCAFFRYPWIREHLVQSHPPVPVQIENKPLCKKYGIDGNHWRSLYSKRGADQEDYVVQGTVLMSPSYRRQNKIGEQITKRLKAGAAKFELQTPTLNQVNKVITLLNIQADFTHPVIDKTLGYIVALNSAACVDLEVKKENLMSIPDIATHYTLDVVSQGLLEQQRMTLENFKCKTLHIAFLYIGLMRQHQYAFTPAGLAQLNELEKLEERLRDRPYIHCVSELKTDETIASVSIPVAVALSHAETLAKKEGTEETWKEFNAQNIFKKISSTTERDRAKQIASLFPTNKVSLTAALLSTATPNNCAKLLMGFSEDLVEAVSQGARVAKITNLLRDDLEMTKTRLLRSLNPIEDAVVQAEKRRAIYVWYEGLNAELTAGEDAVVARIGRAKDALDQEARTEVVALFTLLNRKVNEGPV